MKRTTIEIPINNYNIDEIINIISAKTQSEGYEYKILDGEQVWLKGDGVMMKMQCIGIAFSENSVFLQGWMKDAILGESNLEGNFVAVFPKKKMKALMNDIRDEIVSKNF